MTETREHRASERRQVAAECAQDLYRNNDDVDVLPGDWLVESPEPQVESVDGGYWVQARVWVDAAAVEMRMQS